MVEDRPYLSCLLLSIELVAHLAPPEKGEPYVSGRGGEEAVEGVCLTRVATDRKVERSREMRTQASEPIACTANNHVCTGSWAHIGMGMGDHWQFTSFERPRT